MTRILLACLIALCVSSARPIGAQEPTKKEQPALPLPRPVGDSQAPAEDSKGKAPFEAFLLILEADWSKSPTAKQVDADLRTALKGATIPKELGDDLLLHGPEILFGDATVEYYRRDACASLLAWLEKHKLLRRQLPFSPLLRGGWAGRESTLEVPSEILAVPDFREDGSLPFIETRLRWKWLVQFDPSAVNLHVTRVLELLRSSQGQPLPPEPEVSSQSHSLDWRDDFAIFVHAFPGANSYHRRTAAADAKQPEMLAFGRIPPVEVSTVHRQGVYPVLLILREGRSPVRDAAPAVRIPDVMGLIGPLKTKSRARDFGTGLDSGFLQIKKPDTTDTSTEKVNPVPREQRKESRVTAPPREVTTDSPPPDAAPEVKPPFEASLLMLEADWSKSPTAKQVHADLEAALKGVPIPKELRENVLSHGPEILFSDRNIVHYEPRASAALLAWLDKHKLIRKRAQTRSPLPVRLQQRPFIGKSASEQPDQSGFETDLIADGDLLPIPDLPDPEARPFVESRLHWKWELLFATPSNTLQVARTMERVRFLRGEAQHPPESAVFWSMHALELPRVDTIFVSAFGLSENDAVVIDGQVPVSIRQFVARHGVYPVLMIRPTAEALPKDVGPALQIPANVIPTGENTTNPQLVKAPPIAEESRGAGVADAPAVKRESPGSKRDEASDPGRDVTALRREYASAEATIARTARQIREAQTANAAPVAVEKLRTLLQVQVAETFEIGQKLHEAELAEFRQRMERLQQTIDERRRNSERIIDRRVSELLDPALKWETVSPADSGPDAATRAAEKPASDLEGVWEMKENPVLQYVFLGNLLAGFAEGRIRTLFRFEFNENSRPGQIVLDCTRVAGVPGTFDFVQARYDVKGDELIRKVEGGPGSSQSPPPKLDLKRVSRTIDPNLREAMDRAATTGRVPNPEGVPPATRPPADADRKTDGTDRAKANNGAGISFFGQTAPGLKVVYVIDASGSMNDHDAFAKVCKELRESLASLKPNQQFQILFYNEDRFLMKRQAGDTAPFFWATDENRELARHFMRGIHPDKGTRHLAAAVQALNYNPDVIFFVSDGGEPILRDSDLAQISKRNKGRTRINTIELGSGAALPKEGNFLKKLATENSGEYAHRDRLAKAQE